MTWRISSDECPWTCGDSATAIEFGEPLGHTEILVAIVDGDGIPVAYVPWEPLASEARQKQLRLRIAAIAAVGQELSNDE